MKKLIQTITTAFAILIGNVVLSQVDSVYFVKGDSILSVYATTDVDSVIFYRPDGPSETSSVKYGEGATDIDGNAYQSVIIGTQEWMSENLRTTKYSDGNAIPNVTGTSEWKNLSTGAWCNYHNSSTNDATYGKLYNWYAVETGKLCPTGWHVPTDAEWTDLTNYLTANGHPGEVLKSTSGWNDYNGQSGNGTDIYGWNGLPGGSRFNHGIFFDNGDFGYWFSSTDFNTQYAWFHLLEYSYNDIYSDYWNKNYGFSVRCLRD